MVEADAIIDMAVMTCNSISTITSRKVIVVTKADRTTKVVTIISMRSLVVLVDHSHKWAMQEVRTRVR